MFAQVVEAGTWPALGILVAVLAAIAAAVWYDVRLSGHPLPVYLGFRAMWLFCKWWQDFRPRRPDPLPRCGPALVIANHTCPIDPLYLQCCSRRVISFMMAREYFGLKLLRPLIQLCSPILVSRSGRDTAGTKAALRALRDGRVIGIFPEGRINLGLDSMLQGKSGAAMMALLARVRVIPAFIDRSEHTNELFKGIFKPVPTRVYFGPPLDLSPYYETRRDRAVVDAVTELMMQSIARLRPGRIGSPVEHCG
jgi:1-acyl-sn-glycerol-3-phosphate acyltransferase